MEILFCCSSGTLLILEIAKTIVSIFGKKNKKFPGRISEKIEIDNVVISGANCSIKQSGNEV